MRERKGEVKVRVSAIEPKRGIQSVTFSVKTNHVDYWTPEALMSHPDVDREIHRLKDIDAQEIRVAFEIEL